MPISVQELTAAPDLGCRIIVGSGGAHRTIAWAHVCELTTPWEWLGDGDLVMTTGLAIPRGDAEQVSYVRGCVDVGIVGIAVGEDMSAPPLSEAMLTTADELDFCIIMTSYEVPFVAVSRTVAHANQLEEQDRLMRTMQIYDTVRQTIGSQLNGTGLVAALGTTLQLDLFVVDPLEQRVLLPSAATLPTHLRRALSQVFARRTAPAPAMLPLPVGANRQAVALALPGQRRATLVAGAGRASPRLDSMMLQHVAYVAALELARRDADRERELRLGSALLARLVDGVADADDARQRFAERGLARETVVVVAADCDQSRAELHHTLGDQGIPHLLLVRRDLMLLLTTDTDNTVATLADLAPPVGVSAPVEDPMRVSAAAVEARSALEAAKADRVGLRRYGEDNDSTLVPRRVEAAQALVDRVLGVLLGYDRDHRSELTVSLRVFLEENRSWSRAAVRLCVHKQTLVYRIGRVAELTGRRTDRTDDVAELWVALKAYDSLNVPTRPDKRNH